MHFEYRLRPATHADLPPLFAIHIAAFRESVEPTWGWDLEAQRRIFTERFDTTVAQVIEGPDGAIIGEQVVRTRDDAVFLDRVALHPRWQGRGIGSRIVGQVVASAVARRLPVRLHVLRTNPRARSLYERLGFRISGGDADRHFMVKDGEAGT